MAASDAGARVIALVNKLRNTVKITRYQSATRIKERRGLYAFDCSGMAAWFLKKTAPDARRAMRSRRPRAIDFYLAIARAPMAKPSHGWLQLKHVSDARPGDLFAFPKSPISKSNITGHVGFFVERPWPVEGIEGGWAARIVDATKTPHQYDTRKRDGDGGFGFGTMMFFTNGAGKTFAYGWQGTNNRFMPTHVVYGRVTQ